MSVAVIVDGRVRHLVAKGYANRWAGVRATPDTIYPFGGITQTFTATSVASLAAGRIRLEDPVEKYLGGVRIKGQEPRNPVTLRHVLAHASGLIDSREPLEMHQGTRPAQPAPLLFSDVLFAARPPETEARYSSVGYGALGLVLSGLTGQTIPEYFREKWLLPLDMQHTGFTLPGSLKERLAMGYTRPPQGDPEALQMFDHSPASPLLTADGLAGTAGDLAQWLLLHLNHGRAGDRELIPEQTINTIHRIQFPPLRGPRYLPQSLLENDGAGWGLGWLVWPCGAGRCIGHIGSVKGYTAMIAGNLDLRNGVVVLTNSDAAQTAVVALSKALLEVAGRETQARRGMPVASGRQPGMQ